MLRQLKINSRKWHIYFRILAHFTSSISQLSIARGILGSTQYYYCGKKEVIYLESKYIKLVSKMCDDRKISKISTRSRIASGYANACGSSPIISWVRSPSNEPPCLSNLLPMSTLNFSICRAPSFQHQRRHNFFENHEMPLLLHIHFEKSS